MNKPLIEGCVDSYASSLAAYAGGADRLELCANLVIGGTTPSAALFRQVQKDCPLRINVLIRPRFGDFLYTKKELEEMGEEIQMFRDLGAGGIVTGVLTPDGDLDTDAMSRLMDCGKGMEFTLHRAFDMTREPFAALESAVSLGCQTVLTSGQAPSAPAGADLLAALFRQSAGRVDIMAGGGVKSNNILGLHRRTGIRVFHTSGRRGNVESGMVYRKATVSMGLPSLSEYEIFQTDQEEFRVCAQIVHGLV